MTYSNIIKKLVYFTKELLKILFITFVFILLIDFFFGNKILNTIDPYLKETEFYDKRFRVFDDTFHHTFKKNINVKTVGIEENIRFCTNNLGFKSNCNTKKKSYFKFGFLGDSFTEGIQLNYESTFVGLFEKELGEEVANLGVSSYSPKIHLAKLNFFLNKGVVFDHIILFLDISDYYDESFYKIDNNKLKIIHNKKDTRRIWLKKNFPFTNYYFYVVKKIKKSLKSKEKKIVSSSKIVFDESVQRKTIWLDKDVKKFKINNKTIFEIHNETKNYVNQIYNILEEKNIKFSIAIYPWPQNFLNKKNNFFYVNEWKDFCKNKCNYFFDYFEVFNQHIADKEYEKIYKKFYIKNDVHFNKKGNILIADKIIQTLLNK